MMFSAIDEACGSQALEPNPWGFGSATPLARDPATEHLVLDLTALGFELDADGLVRGTSSLHEFLLQLLMFGGSPDRGDWQRLRRPEPIRFGKLMLDPNACHVWVEDELIELTALEFRLLLTLYERRDQVQSRAALLRLAWGRSANHRTRTVDTHVRRLRNKLKTASHYVQTVRGVGYRLIPLPDGNSNPTPRPT